MTTIATPAVIGGELIEADWGNNVRGDLIGLNTDKLERSGTQAMTGNLNMASNNIINLADPSGDAMAVPRKWALDRFALISGQVFTGDVTAATLRSAAGTAIGANAVIVGSATVANGLTLTAGNAIIPSGLVRTGNDPATTGTGVEMASNGSISMARGAGDGTIHLIRRGGAPAAGENYVRFMVGAAPGAQAGAIAHAAGPGVTYGTTSDYRMKTERGGLDDAVARLRALRPIRYGWKGKPKLGEFDGFLAHEVAEVVPEAVAGEKDAEDADGIVPQSLDMGRLVPLLTAALQDALDRIEVLEGK